MEENRNIQIIIRPVNNRQGEHIAYYTNEFLKATFSVHIKDNKPHRPGRDARSMGRSGGGGGKDWHTVFLCAKSLNPCHYI